MKRKTELTEKQKQFVDTYVKTSSIKEAAKAAYSVSNDSVAVAVGRKVISYPKVQKAISVILNEAGLCEKGLVQELAKIIFTPKKEDNKLKAIRTAFELHGSFNTDVVIEDNVELFSEYDDNERKQIIRDLVTRIAQKDGVL